MVFLGGLPRVQPNMGTSRFLNAVSGWVRKISDVFGSAQGQEGRVAIPSHCILQVRESGLDKRIIPTMLQAL